MFRRALLALALPVLLVTAACGGDPSETDESLDDVTSATATLMQFEFDGQFTTSSNLNLKAQTKGQLFYLVGQLNAHMSVARLDRLTIVTETSTAIAGGLYLVKYHAKIPVAWGSKTNLPSTVTLRLPLRVDTTGLANFWSKYNVSCGEQIGDEITAGNFWFHIRPEQSGCALAAADTFTT
ncbi:MAG: hypothetical protein JST92_11745, partial [Deltaproteobacteria bacterium]|nr:hypothetical protein [Deltaproteobacteria bacterium]